MGGDNTRVTMKHHYYTVAFNALLLFCIIQQSLQQNCADYKVIRQSGSYVDPDTKQFLNCWGNGVQSGESELVVLIDTSGSMGRYGFNAAKDFVESLLGEIRIAFNATRIAVGTFSTQHRINFNYILNPSYDNHKCKFNDDFSKITFDAMATDIRGALKDGYNVFAELISNKQKHFYRETSNKAVIFISDGYGNIVNGKWDNAGRDPTPEATDLRTAGFIEVFSVALTRGSDQNTLKNIIATHPSLYLFQPSFSQLQDLAKKIRGDPYEKDYETFGVAMSYCGACDSSAKCGCNLRSGKYRCVCPKGYYGTAEKASTATCNRCPVNTYGTVEGLDVCTPCPSNSGTKGGTTRTRQSDCYCDDGYQGNPGTSTTCTPRPCSAPIAITNGFISNPDVCSSDKAVFGVACHYNCNPKYELAGANSILTCGSQGTWSGATPHCQLIHCPKTFPLNDPSYSAVCTNAIDSVKNAYPIDTSCTFTCQTGYYKSGGSTKVTCQDTKLFDGPAIICKEILCPLVPRTHKFLESSKLSPDCLAKNLKVGERCEFTCSHSFRLKGVSVVACNTVDQTNPVGTWSSDIATTPPTCEDITPPDFGGSNENCTQGYTLSSNTLPGLSYGWVNFTALAATDNSGDEPVVTSSVGDYELGKSYKVNYTLTAVDVTFTATDGSGMTRVCRFKFEVLDKEIPEKVTCPDNIVVSKTGSQIVTWTEPVFRDNCGPYPACPLSISPTINSGSLFVEGILTPVAYTCTDPSGNRQETCSFTVLVQSPTCPYLQPPRNGAVAKFGSITMPQCQSPYFPVKAFPYFYSCQNGNWTANGQEAPETYFPIPDCTMRTPPTGLLQPFYAFYWYNGDCNQEATKSLIKANFNNFQLCADPKCTTDSIEIFCGEATAVRRRRRDNSKTVAVSITYKIKKTDQASIDNPTAAQTELKNDMANNLAPKVLANAAAINPKQIEPDLSTRSAPKVDGSPSIVCAKDNDMSDNGATRAPTLTCAECAAGQFMNVKTRTCEKCPPGTFQPHAGKTECISCPEGTTSIVNDVQNFTSCKRICSPGEFSSNGLAPCNKCTFGQYSTADRSLTCQTCSTGTTTVIAGAKSQFECGSKCQSGSYSDSGVEPCQPCPKGTYQNSIGELACTNCPDVTSTYGTGSKSPLNCVDIDDCASNPCLNQGHCIDLKDSFRCECTNGFWGKTCEKEVDDCALKPCVNGGKCLDKFQKYECVCKQGTSGARCDVINGVCTATTCSGHGLCKNLANNDFKCDCNEGYAGTFCEASINVCLGDPCLNQGHCYRTGPQTYKCNCKTGYSGPTCNVKNNFCENNPCHHGATCEDKDFGFTCKCAPGYEGETCAQKIDMCVHTPCKNGGTCTAKVSDVTCNCAPSYGGKHCETKLSHDYDLALTSRLSASYSTLKGRQDMSATTVAFWMRTYDIYNTGTPISYAVQIPGGKLEDNALVIADYRSFDFTVNNVTAAIGVTANDGTWHHVAVTWDSASGSWVSYKDGVEARRSTAAFQKGQVIRGGGLFVLGEEQDQFGAGFTPSESFFGDISQLNIWNRVLSANDIYDLASVPLAAEGNVVAWSDFSVVQRGRTLKKSPSVVAQFSASLRGFGVIRDHTFHSTFGASTRTATSSGTTASDCATTCASASYKEWCRAFVFHRTTNKCYHFGNSLLMTNGEEVLDLDKDLYQLGCVKDLGMTLRTIPDSAITAGSSQVGKEAYKARLFNTPQEAEHTYWSPSTATGRYIDINLGRLTRVTGVATQGHPNIDTLQFVKSYTISYKTSSSAAWQAYKHPSGGATVTFTANTNSLGVVRNEMFLTATNIRLNVITWAPAGIALRLEVYGCSDSPQGVPTPKSDSNQCAASPCLNGGVCFDLYNKYSCECVNGYTGSRCETVGGCPTPDVPIHGKVSSLSVSAVVYGCNTGYDRSGPTSVACTNGVWAKSPPTCADKNECTLNKCSHGCINTEGSFKCYCPRGYTLGSDGKTCQDVNECATANGDCDQTCTNTVGAFQCSCNSGYQLTNGKSCVDIDECSGSTHGCQQLCTNSAGSYVCGCEFGYQLNGNGKTCSYRTCSNLPTIQNGGVTISGSTGTYHCNSGYRVDGITTRECLPDGQWSGVEPKCKLINCIPLKEQNVKLSVNGNVLNSKAQFSCQPTYLLIGTNSRTCQTSGEWTGIYPRCVYATCAPLANPLNGEILGLGSQAGSVVRTQCNQGYRLVQSALELRTCQSSGQWSGGNSAVATCQLVDCGSPPRPTNGDYVLQGGTKYQARAKYTCSQSGSQRCLEGIQTRICQADGKWSSTLPSCQAKSCCTPPVPAHSTLHSDNVYPYGSKVYIKCDVGYVTGGTEYRTCQSSGAYTGTSTTCTIVDCGSPGSVSNGVRIGYETFYESKARFFCDPGYKLAGSSERTCQADGKWSGTSPSCSKSACGGVVRDVTGNGGTLDVTDGSGDCHWLIQIQEGKKVTIDVTRYELAVGDTLSVYDGQSYDSFVTFSAYTVPKPITGNSHYLRITYKGINGAGKGFTLNYKQSSCGGFISAAEGVITTPGYPIKYPANTDCYWTIHRPYDKIQLVFREFQLVQNQYDYAEMSEGPFKSSNLVLYKRYGITRPSLLREWSDRWVWVHFHSDATYESQGFYLLHGIFIPRKIELY